ncbi:NusA-like transcription termination signal-binding factor [Candidatus Woesearchaeota archaeon]|nr:MAG: NusA-like transcription termination signal-binding factor [Candidatus Woesearchaeota archaeon]
MQKTVLYFCDRREKVIQLARIKYDASLMKYMSLFEKVTRARVKDCFSDKNNILVFVVQETQLGKAVGKKGVMIKKLESIFKRRLKVVEFSNDLVQFVKNYVYPIETRVISEEDGIVVIEGADARAKGLLIGRNAQNLRALEEVCRRYFSVKEIKVV